MQRGAWLFFFATTRYEINQAWWIPTKGYRAYDLFDFEIESGLDMVWSEVDRTPGWVTQHLSSLLLVIGVDESGSVSVSSAFILMLHFIVTGKILKKLAHESLPRYIRAMCVRRNQSWQSNPANRVVATQGPNKVTLFTVVFWFYVLPSWQCFVFGYTAVQMFPFLFIAFLK